MRRAMALPLLRDTRARQFSCRLPKAVTRAELERQLGYPASATAAPRAVKLELPDVVLDLRRARVTWEQGLQPYPLKIASGAWDISLAGGMCLEFIGDAVDTLPPGARQAIHFARGEVDAITQDFDPATGALKSVTVTTPFWDNAKAAFLLGRALGLERSTNAKNSVMSYPNSDRDSPGTDDQTSLRALYGPPQAWCR